MSLKGVALIPDWRLVICVLDDAGAKVVGWTMSMSFASYLPDDSGKAGCRWESASLILDDSDLSPGLPLN